LACGSTTADTKYVPALRLAGTVIVVIAGALVLAARPLIARTPTSRPAPGVLSPSAMKVS